MAGAHHSSLAGFPGYARRASRIHPRPAGLVITAVLSCVTLATAIILARMPQPEPTEKGAETSEVVAAAPRTPTLQAMASQMPVPQLPESPAAQTVQTDDSSTGIRIIDLSPDKNSSCKENVWPYIDQRCLAATKYESQIKREAKSEPKVGTKIGPRPIDARAQPVPPANSQDNIPIGSMTAIVPARPKVSVTDGVATREPEERAAETGPVEVAEPRARMSTGRTRDTTRTLKSVRIHQFVEQPKADQPRRRASVERKKKYRQVADAGRKAGYRQTASGAPDAIYAPRFFFPFGWFSQAR